METRRRSTRLQLQTANAQNLTAEPTEPNEPTEPPKKKNTRNSKKNEVPAAMKAPKSAPMPKAMAPAKKKAATTSRKSKSTTPEDPEDPEDVGKKEAPPQRHALSESSSDDDDEMPVMKNAPKSAPSAPEVSKFAKNAPKPAKNAPESPEVSDEEMDVDAPNLAQNAPKSAKNAPNFAQHAPKPAPTASRPRRSITTTKRVSYVQKDLDLDGIDELSSSSSSEEEEASDSEDVVEETPQKAKTQKRGGVKAKEVIPKKRSKSFKIEEEEEDSSDSYESGLTEEDSEGSEAPGPSSRPISRKFHQKNRSKTSKNGEKKDMNWPKCSKASIARKTGNPKNSKIVKSGLRMAIKPKPPQPWRKNLANYEADRKLAKGERRMLEYRKVAHAYARGKIEEVSYDECFKIHENMKKAYMEGRAIIDALEPEKLGAPGGDRLQKKKHLEHKDSLDGQDSESSEDGQDSSEDEWEEMEHFHPVLDDAIEVSIDHEGNDEDGEEGVEKDWWVVYLRQEVNKKIRESWENTHKVHLLCYMAHLKLVVKTAIDESLVPSLMMSQLPNGYQKYVGKIIPIDVLTSMVKWFSDAFRPLNGVVSVAAIEQDLLEGHEARFPETSRLTALVDGKCFETDLDRATLLFCLLRGLEATCRIVVNARTIPRKWDKNQQKELQDEIDKFREISRSRSATPKNEQLEQTEQNEPKNAPSTSSAKKTPPGKNGPKKSKKNEPRNYWVEYWQPFEKRWICIDPLHKTVDEPLTIHEDATSPISYVFAIDHRYGIVEVSQRYAMDCVKQEFRRRRTDPKWIAWTLSLRPFAANLERKKWEAMQMREDLVKRPLPTTMSEYKNHPLYVLEKDLLKFEAIYPPPETQKPLGQIRGHNVYPRSCVFTLQGENNWLKLARSVKIGEEPYKVVKARPNFKIPAEDREDQFLNVYGYWQTEEYRRPALKNGKIPHNDYGNVYMFQANMCPLECVHLKLPQLVQLSRKLNKQCVPAVVGWAFDGGFTHPVIDGAIVLEKDAPLFIREWEKLEEGRAEREEKARVEKIHENWKTLIKGMLRLAYVRKQFGGGHQNLHEMKIQKKIQNPKEKKIQKKGVQKEEDMEDDGAGPSEPPHHIIDNSAKKGPIEGFSLDDFINKKK